MTYTPRPGDYGCVHTTGFFGKLIRIGTMSRWNHCFIYVGDGLIVEANPTGVALSAVKKYDKIAWNKHERLSALQRTMIVDNAYSCIGDSYSFGTIAGLVLRILGLKIFGDFLLKRLAKHEGYICSELVAEAYSKAQVNLLDRPDYLVNPGDLAERLIWQ